VSKNKERTNGNGTKAQHTSGTQARPQDTTCL